MVPMQRREADMMEEKVTNWGTRFILWRRRDDGHERFSQPLLGIYLAMMGLDNAYPTEKPSQGRVASVEGAKPRSIWGEDVQ